MGKRFGSVAKASPALKRLTTQLSTFNGLGTVVTTAASGVVLHGASNTQIGISECHYLFKEMEKCKAGGLPPPVTIPDEEEVARRESAAKDERGGVSVAESRWP